MATTCCGETVEERGRVLLCAGCGRVVDECGGGDGCGAAIPTDEWHEHECYWTRAEAHHARMME